MAVLTDKQEYDLNNSNEAMRKAQIGTMLKNGVSGGGGSSYVLPSATKTALGGVKQGVAVADSNATEIATLVASYNALLAVLRNTGIIA